MKRGLYVLFTYLLVSGPVSAATFSARVGASADDCHAERTPATVFSITLATNYIGTTGDPDVEHAGVRYTNVTIPYQATITSAILTLRADATQSGTVVNVTIKSDSATNPATFSTASDWNARVRSSASVAWNSIPSWTSGTDYDSPDISTVIQGIVNRTGWASGNALVLFIENASSTNFRQFESWDGSSTLAPLLTVVYTVNNVFALGRGANEAVDNRLRQQNPTVNYGTDTAAYWGGERSAGVMLNYLFSFPTLATNLYGRMVDSAKLTLYVVARDAVAIDVSGFYVVRPAQADWSETQSTWRLKKTGVNWGDSGATSTTTDIFPTAYNTFNPATLTAGVDNVLNVTALLQAVDNTDTTSAGFILRHTGTPEGGQEEFKSGNVVLVSRRPYLQVWWSTPAAGGTPTYKSRIIQSGSRLGYYQERINQFCIEETRP